MRILVEQGLFRIVQRAEGGATTYEMRKDAYEDWFEVQRGIYMDALETAKLGSLFAIECECANINTAIRSR